MKLNIANPSTGAQKKIDIDDENRLQLFMDRRIAETVPGDSLGDEFKGYVFKITGGNDSDGFPMRQGVLVNKRVKLLLRRGMPCYKARRKGERRRKAVRGCIVGPDIAALSLTIVKVGDNHLPGLTDTRVDKRLGPKRVGKICKVFNLSREDDVRRYRVGRKVTTKNGNKIVKKCKIQRLITPGVLQRRRQIKKKIENRKKASLAKRTAYFEKLTQKSQAVKQTKSKIQKSVKPKKQQQKGGPKKAASKGKKQRKR